MRSETILRPDSKGRITLGAVAKGISSYRMVVDEHQRITLEPYTEIPARERWLFENKEAMAAVLKGLEQSAKGQTRSLGSFAAHGEDDE